MNYNLLKKQDPVYMNTKSLNQYYNIKAQTSDEIQALEIYENSIVVFDDMLFQNKKAILICFYSGAPQ